MAVFKRSYSESSIIFFLLLVCSTSKLPAAAPLYLVRESVGFAAADDGSEVSGCPRGCSRTALPLHGLLDCSLQ